jgi:uncharacterized membrane protein
MSDPLFVLAMLALVAASAERLAQTRLGRPLGGALLAIALAAVLANLRIIPTASNAPPLYEQLLAVGASVSIFLMLLDVHLAALRRAGAAMLIAFAIGALGTVIGVLVAFYLTGAREWLGEFAAPMSGMYVATYIGGSANFNALALHYDVVHQGLLFAGANAVDNVATSLWLIALLILPRLVHRWLGTRPLLADTADAASESLPPPRELTLASLSTLLAMAFGAHWLAGMLAGQGATMGLPVPAVLILTTLALIAAQLPAVQRLGGAQLLGTYGAYLFLAVIGAYCDLAALIELGRIGAMLMLFVGLAVLVHGLVVFGGGALLRLSPEVMAVASSANVGGAATALPISNGLGRPDLLLPGILVGSLGTALGSYAGFAVVWLLAG